MCFLTPPPHLLKNVRNALYRYNIRHADGVAKWSNISDLFKQDLAKKYQLAPRLTTKHVELPPFCQMKVKLASQVLSHSTAAALHTHVAIGSMSAETTATAVFCQNFNDLFDCFNSLSTSGKVRLLTAISNTSGHMRKLNALTDWLKTVKIPDPKTGNDMSKFRCFSGWLQAIQALQKLWAVVSLHEGARFLLTRWLNQDTLEHFFSIFRSRGGFRDNPTPYEFLHAFKQASFNHLLLPACSGNYSIDVAQLVPILLAADPCCHDTSLPTRPNVINSSACVTADR